MKTELIFLVLIEIIKAQVLPNLEQIGNIKDAAYVQIQLDDEIMSNIDDLNQEQIQEIYEQALIQFNQRFSEITGHSQNKITGRKLVEEDPKFKQLISDHDLYFERFDKRMQDLHEQWDYVKFLAKQDKSYENYVSNKFGDLSIEQDQLSDIFQYGNKYVETIDLFQQKMMKVREEQQQIYQNISIQDEIAQVIAKHHEILKTNKERYFNITKSFMNFGGMFEIQTTKIYGYQAKDMQIADFPTNEMVLALSISKIQEFRLTRLIYSLNDKGSIASLQFFFGEFESPRYGENLEAPESFFFPQDRPIRLVKVSYGSFHIGKIGFFDQKGKRILQVGNGQFKKQQDIKFDDSHIWVGVNAKYEQGDFMRGIGFKTAVFQ